MHPAGTRAFEERDRRKDQIYSYERPPQELPDERMERLRADAAAWAYLQRQPTSSRNVATKRVMSAGRPETRERRLVSLIETGRDGTRPRPFLVPGHDRPSAP